MSIPIHDELDCGLLLIAHLICADGQIHIEEDRALQLFSKQNSIGLATRDTLSAIFSMRPEAPTLKEVAQRVPPNCRNGVLEQLVAVGHVDSYYAPIENDFIEQVASLWNIDLVEVKRLRTNAEQFPQPQSEHSEFESHSNSGTAFKKVELFLAKWLKDIAPEAVGRRIDQLQEEVLLAGPEYKEAIEQCAEIAHKDYQLTARKLESASQALTLLNQNIDSALAQLGSQISRTGKAENLNSVVSQLESTRQNLRDTALKEIENLKLSLQSKNRSLNRFSIAFMGKTKAGKSTLHAIVTGEGWDAIGVGKQRTTRYNRVYDWKNIRIIDTPGIGAPGGQSDEEIAEGVVEEADVICYVVTNDSIQEIEFEFLKVLKDRAKPLIILLNIKNNLREKSRLEYFLNNPDKLFRKEGKSGIGGHFERIKCYASEHYANQYFDIIPVMLLAAQMSCEKQYEKQSAQLRKASRLNVFLDSLRVSIIEHGTIRRSQTLLGSTVYSIEQPRQWAEAQASIYHELAETISNKQKQLKQDFDRAVWDIEAELTQQIKSIFGDIRNSIDTFSTEHWEDSEQDLKKAWQKKLSDSKLERRLKTEIENAQKNLEARTRQILEEIGKELELLADFNISASQFSQSAGNFFERNKDYLKLGAALLGAAGACAGFFLGGGILAGAVALIGTSIGLFANSLKDKSKRRIEATHSICAELSRQLKNHELEVLKNTENQLENLSQSTTDSLNKYFKYLSDGLEKISKYLYDTDSTLRSSVDNLNIAYAERIIEWATGHKQAVRKVQRDFVAKRIEIWVTEPHPLKKDLQELSQILQEDLIVHY